MGAVDHRDYGLDGSAWGKSHYSTFKGEEEAREVEIVKNITSSNFVTGLT